VTNIRVLTHEFGDPKDDFETDPNAVARRTVPAGVEVYEISGPFFFGAAERFKDRLTEITGRPKVLILRMRHVPAIDSTGLHAPPGRGAPRLARGHARIAVRRARPARGGARAIRLLV